GERFGRLRLPVFETGLLETGDGPIPWRLWKAAASPSADPLPLLVRVYGGPGSRLVEDRWDGGVLFDALLVARGWQVLEADGRGTRGFGARRVRAVRGRLGLGEVEDQARVVRHLARRPDVDGRRVGILGWSFGGTLACLALTRHGDVFRAGVAIAPVTDWRLYDTIYTERYLGLPQVDPAAYRATAATTHAGGLDGWLLLVHGTADENVHVENTERLAAALEAAGKPSFEVMRVPGRRHGLGGARRKVFRRVLAFLDEHLAGGDRLREPQGARSRGVGSGDAR
ncbi:MAG: alpha/beta hydrolase family protein, partial [Planctomycetota bacterium]